MNGRHVFYGTLVVAFTLLGLVVLWRLAETIVVLFAAVIFASAIRPLVDRLGRFRIPRGLAILLIYLVLFGSVVTLLVVAIPPLYAVISDLVQEQSLLLRAAHLVLDVAQQLGYGRLGAQAFVQILEADRSGLLQEQVQRLATERGPTALQSAGIGLGQFFLGLVMCFYWLTARDKIQGLMLSITPIRHRGRLETVFNDVEHTLGDYVRGTALLMLSIGVSAFVGLLVLRVPNALPLALLAGLFEAIPMVGAAMGAIPAVLVAFTVSPVIGLLTIILFLLIQFLENNVLVPRVMERSVGLNPLIVIIAIVAGSTLNGFVGALLAIPVAAALQVITRHLIVNPMIQQASQSTVEHGITVFQLDDAEPSTPSEIVIAQP